MKIKSLFLGIAALATMMMVSCGDEETENIVAGDNEIVIDNVKYALESHVTTEGGVPRYLDCYEPVAEGEDYSYNLIADVSSNNLNADLTTVPSGEYYFAFQSSTLVNFSQGFEMGEWGETNSIDGQEFPKVPIFESGTLIIKTDDAGLTYSINGVLKNGKTISLKVYVPKEDFERAPWED